METRCGMEVSKSERALQILCYYKAKAIVVPYINLKYTSWGGEKIRMEYSSLVILKSLPTVFDVMDFLEGIREHWLFEIRDDGGLEIDVYVSEVNLEGDE